ncbi:MAG: helix-turn-helix transcriptional regulator [Bacteroidota bacterium]
MKNTVRMERARLKMSQQEFAEKLGVSRQTVHSIETGKFIPSCLLALKIAVICEQSVEDIFIIEKKDWEK